MLQKKTVENYLSRLFQFLLKEPLIMFKMDFDPKKFSKDFGKHALAEMSKSIRSEIRKIRCKTHGKSAIFKSSTPKGFDLTFCCDELQKEVENRLK
jgi:hypothetical protein